MFRTFKEAEMPAFSIFAREGSSSWSFIELPLNTTYFLAKFNVVEGDVVVGQTLLYSDIRDALALKGVGSARSQEVVTLVELSILAPRHVHGGEGYKLARLKCVKASVKTRHAYLFILDDGTQLRDTFCTPEIFENEAFEIIASFD